MIPIDPPYVESPKASVLAEIAILPATADQIKITNGFIYKMNIVSADILVFMGPDGCQNERPHGRLDSRLHGRPDGLQVGEVQPDARVQITCLWILMTPLRVRM